VDFCFFIVHAELLVLFKLFLGLQKTAMPELKTIPSHCQNFALTVDLDGVARTVDSDTRTERTFWTLTCCLAAAVAIFLTATVLLNYISGPSYDTSYRLDEEGLAKFPDILLCTSAPWDLELVEKHGISSDLLSYVSNFLFPFAGFGENGIQIITDDFIALDKEYNKLLPKFDNNTMYLLQNITKPCESILTNCVFGTVISYEDCCAFFGPSEFMLGNMCFRTTRSLYFAVQEAGMMNSIMFRLEVERRALDGLNVSLINPAARLLSSQMAIALSDNRSHTSLSQSRQVS
jgi:Amiloride-sensitive sodium channel